jgi:hypothetical protein
MAAVCKADRLITILRWQGEPCLVCPATMSAVCHFLSAAPHLVPQFQNGSALLNSHGHTSGLQQRGVMILNHSLLKPNSRQQMITLVDNNGERQHVGHIRVLQICCRTKAANCLSYNSGQLVAAVQQALPNTTAG